MTVGEAGKHFKSFQEDFNDLQRVVIRQTNRVE